MKQLTIETSEKLDAWLLGMIQYNQKIDVVKTAMVDSVLHRYNDGKDYYDFILPSAFSRSGNREVFSIVSKIAYYEDYDAIVPFSSLKDEVIVRLCITKASDRESDAIWFYTASSKVYKMCHIQDCCEEVWIDSIVGDHQSLIGSPILLAEESSGSVDTGTEEHGTVTWTFYKLATVKGYVDIRWNGSSNGYYSEDADFLDITDVIYGAI